MKLSEMRRKRHDIVVPGIDKPVRLEFTFRGIEFLQDVVPGPNLMKELTDKSRPVSQKMRTSAALVFAAMFDEVAPPGDLLARFDRFKADPRWTVETLGPLSGPAFGAFLSFMGMDLEDKEEGENPPDPAVVPGVPGAPEAGPDLTIPSTTGAA